MLDRALVSPDPSETVFPRDLEALSEVCRRLGGQPFCLEPVAVELVQAVLRDFYGGETSPKDAWRSISLDIAQTLLDDPALSERFSGLWARLVRASSP